MTALNKKSILVYGLKEDELKKVKNLPFRVIEITDEMTAMKVNDIINGSEEVVKTDKKPSEKAVFFNGFSQNEMNRMISTIRKFVKGGLLAVVTPVSVNWSVNYYIEHLIEEREAYLKGKRG